MRHTARGILSQVNHDLLVRKAERVVLCPGELTREWGVDFLIRGASAPDRAATLAKIVDFRGWSGTSRIYDLLQYDGVHRW